MKPTHLFRAFRPELRESDLPEGVIGQVAGIALVYDELDTQGSTFARGSLERTIRERVKAGKVKLYWDHGDAPMTGFYDTDLHIGTVRSLTDVQLPDGRWAAYMVADLMDVPKAHEAKKYLQSVLSSGGETGLSVGGLSKGIRSEMVRRNGDPVERITEFPLSEISITSMQAVPDSEVLAVRSEGGAPATDLLDELTVTVVEDPPATPPPGIDLTTGKPVVAEPVVRCTAGKTVWELLEQGIASVRGYVTDPATVTPETLTTLLSTLEDALAARRPKKKAGEDLGYLPGRDDQPEPEFRATRSSMEAAFEVLLLALPAATVRARVRAVMGDADPVDSNAAGPTPTDSDASAQDSRTTDRPVVYATMEARVLALRNSYAEAP